MVADLPCWVTKVVTAELATTELRSITDRAEVLDHYRTSPAPADVIVLTQMVTDWFAIVETRFRPGADGTTRRKIATYPFDADGRIIGELSYPTDFPGWRPGGPTPPTAGGRRRKLRRAAVRE